MCLIINCLLLFVFKASVLDKIRVVSINLVL